MCYVDTYLVDLYTIFKIMIIKGVLSHPTYDTDLTMYMVLYIITITSEIIYDTGGNWIILSIKRKHWIDPYAGKGRKIGSYIFSCENK